MHSHETRRPDDRAKDFLFLRLEKANMRVVASRRSAMSAYEPPYEAANVILTRPVKGSDLKRWALAVARRAGPRKARVALARKLAVVLHHILRDGTNFIPHKAQATMAA